MLEQVRFGTAERHTPFRLMVWSADLPGDFDDPIKILRLHAFMRLITEETEIVSETQVEVGGRPAIDIVYHKDIPLPEHLAPQDPKVRTLVEEMVAEDLDEYRTRLVFVDDRIVQLFAADAPVEQYTRFFDSLVSAD
jgi:hypothetical protein